MAIAYYGVDTGPEGWTDAIRRGGYADRSVAFGGLDDLPVTLGRDGYEDNNIGLYGWDTAGVYCGYIDNDGGIADIATPDYRNLGLAAGGGSASCNPTTLTVADVSGDGITTSLDALMILQAAGGAIEL